MPRLFLFLPARLLPMALAIAASLLAASSAQSGAWPREKGAGFIASAVNISASSINGPYALYSTTYVELGLGHDLTLGADIGHGVSGKSKAIAFLRRPLGELAPGHLFAAEIGLGEIAGEFVLRPGLSYGHGLSRRNGTTGWLSVEAFSEHRLTTSRVDFKADFTFGLNHSDRLKTILQLQTGKSHGDPFFARLAPSVVMRVSPAMHVELGVTAGLTGDDSYGVRLGFWRDF